ncbi:MAG: hypothetical protein AAB393_08715, partial [Bacteroidota bacterium]
MSWVGLSLAAFIIIAAVVAYAQQSANEDAKRNMDLALERAQHFRATKKVLSVDRKSGIAIDEDSNLVCLLKSVRGNWFSRVIPFSDVVGVETLEDGEAITRFSRGSQIGGIVVGGVLLGAVGAMVGGVTGSRKTKQNVHRIALNVIINDLSSPVHSITFLTEPVARNSRSYSDASRLAQDWQAVFKVIMEKRSGPPEEDYPSEISIPMLDEVESARDEVCENCGAKIGRLEQAFLFDKHVVCFSCNRRLRESQSEAR